MLILVKANARAQQWDRREVELPTSFAFLSGAHYEPLNLGGYRLNLWAMSKVEIAKKALESDLEDYPHALHDPIGDARTYRKILLYLFSCIVEGKDRAESKDWLYKLYKEQTDDEKAILTSIFLLMHYLISMIIINQLQYEST